MKLAFSSDLCCAPRPSAGAFAALALTAGCWLQPGPARAQPVAGLPLLPESRVPAATVSQALRLAADAAQVAAPRKAHVTVEPGRLDPRLTLAPCARIDTYLPAGAPAWGAVRVGLRCVEGAVRWNVFLPVNVQVVAPAVVVTAQLPAGARLEEEHLHRVEVDWSATTSALFDAPEALVGRLLARSMQAGQPVQAAHLQARQWFAQGDTVRIIASGPGFQIISEGQALTAGQEGRPARVQTENGRILTGRPVGDRSVEVSL